MIEKLTKEQEALMAVYVERYTKIGLATDRIEYAKTKKIIDDLYTKILGRKKVPVAILDNPLQCNIACFMYNGVKFEPFEERVDQTQTVRDAIKNRAKGGGVDVEFVSPYLYGSFDSYIFSMYDFYMEIGVKIKTKLMEKYKIWRNTIELGIIYPLDNICFVSQKPLKISMKDGVLHRDGGPAIEYAGGFSVWALNGTRVPRYLAETPAGQLSKDFFTNEKNADVRTEFLAKYGIERMRDHGKLVDSYKNYSNKPKWEECKYELLDMSSLFTNYDYAPFIGMINQTTGMYHLEGVDPKCKTLDDALKYRMEGHQNNIEEVK